MAEHSLDMLTMLLIMTDNKNALASRDGTGNIEVDRIRVIEAGPPVSAGMRPRQQYTGLGFGFSWKTHPARGLRLEKAGWTCQLASGRRTTECTTLSCSKNTEKSL
jgi:hypothetical protein